MRHSVGFTGTQEGMTNIQKAEVERILQKISPIEVHHGDCIGADSDFHTMCENLGYYIVIHPPIKKDKRAFRSAHRTLMEAEYLRRNQDIVNATEILIATPSGPEKQRSGTWSTIRYGLRTKTHVIIVYPDGCIDETSGERVL